MKRDLLTRLADRAVLVVCGGTILAGWLLLSLLALASERRHP